MARQKFVSGNDFKFKPRAFAQNVFSKLDEEEAELQLHEGRMVFRQGEEQTAQATAVYPTVTDIVPSQNTANILKNLMFGQDGFLTAHLSELALSWFANEKDKSVGEFLAKLAQNDGEIFDALGKLVIAYGGNPNFTTSNGRNWTIQHLLLNRTQFPHNLIALERQAIKNLAYAIDNVGNESLKKLLTQIRQDKESKIQDLQKLM